MMKRFCKRSFIGAIVFALVMNTPLALAQEVPFIYEDTIQDFYAENDILHYDKNAAVPTCSVLGGSATIGSDMVVKVDFSLGSDPVQRRINLIDALRNAYGITPEQAAGIVGNFMHESGGKHVPPDVNEGGVVGPPRFSGGYGWAQWTGPRQRTFINFAVEKGFMANNTVNATDAANLAYLIKELNEGYTSTITELRKQTTPEDAAVSFEATFERAGVPALEPRKANARQAFTEYSTGGTAPGTPVVAPGASAGCSQGGGSAAIVGDVAFPLITTKSGIDNPGMFRNGTTDLGGHPYTAYDILVPPGTPVAAFMSGTVTKVGQDRCPGTMISIYNQESDMVISYLHLDESSHVAKGDTVTVGQQIALIGPASPNGCGVAHLHIDAVKGQIRVGCSRLSCSATNKAKFINIGPQLYETFQLLPE